MTFRKRTSGRPTTSARSIIDLRTRSGDSQPSGDADEQEKEEQIVELIPFQKAGLWMGIFIILCAATMKHLHM